MSLYICKLHNEELKYLSQRYTNNDKPEFTDQESMTIYLFSVQQEQRFSISQIYDFADQYLRSWFPVLPAYQAPARDITVVIATAFSRLRPRLLLHPRHTGHCVSFRELSIGHSMALLFVMESPPRVC